MVVMRSRNSCRTLGAPRDGRYPIDVRPRSCEAAERYCTRIIIDDRYQSSAKRDSTAPPLRGMINVKNNHTFYLKWNYRCQQTRQKTQTKCKNVHQKKLKAREENENLNSTNLPPEPLTNMIHVVAVNSMKQRQIQSYVSSKRIGNILNFVDRYQSVARRSQSCVKIFRKQDHWKLVFCICLLFFLWSRYRNHLQLFWLLCMLIHFFWPFCSCMLLFVECIEVGA